MASNGLVLNASDDSFSDLVKEHHQLVVDCWAEWCGPCHMIAPHIESMAEEFKGKITFAKLDTESNQKIPAQYGIVSIPTLLVFKNGKMVGEIVGARPKELLKQEILAKLK